MEAQFAIRVRQSGHPSHRWQLKSCGADVCITLSRDILVTCVRQEEEGRGRVLCLPQPWGMLAVSPYRHAKLEV